MGAVLWTYPQGNAAMHAAEFWWGAFAGCTKGNGTVEGLMAIRKPLANPWLVRQLVRQRERGRNVSLAKNKGAAVSGTLEQCQQTSEA